MDWGETQFCIQQSMSKNVYLYKNKYKTGSPKSDKY